MEQVTSIIVEETDDGELVLELTEQSYGAMSDDVNSRRIVEPPFSINLKADHDIERNNRSEFRVERKIMAEVSEYED